MLSARVDDKGRVWYGAAMATEWVTDEITQDNPYACWYVTHLTWGAMIYKYGDWGYVLPKTWAAIPNG